MNVLFYTPQIPLATAGGVQRVTNTLAKELSNRYGHACYSAYKYGEPIVSEDGFRAVQRVGKRCTARHIADLVHLWSIDAMIIQGVPTLCNKIKKRIPARVVIIYAQHSQPDATFRVKQNPVRSLMRDMAFSRNALVICKDIARVLVEPAKSVTSSVRIGRVFRAAHQASDAIVLLSKGHQIQFLHTAGISESNKLHCIPNPLSFKRFATIDEIERKQKIALIVSRLDETYKRISLALDVWRAVAKDQRADGWSLHIVGDGPDAEAYRRKVQNECVPRVVFLGSMAPNDEYLRSSLFFMTSVSEGFGLTLTEAQQLGTVPIAFKSFVSIDDIITNGVSGVLVRDGDIERFSCDALKLMENEWMRKKMAIEAVKSTHKFSVERIGSMWDKLLKELTTVDA